MGLTRQIAQAVQRGSAWAGTQGRQAVAAASALGYAATGARAAHLDTRPSVLARARTRVWPRPEVVPHLLATFLVGAVALVILLFVLMPAPAVPPAAVPSVAVSSRPPSPSASTIPPAPAVAAPVDIPAPPPVVAEPTRAIRTRPAPESKSVTASKPVRRPVARPAARAAATATTGTRDRRQADASVPPSPAGFRGSLSVNSSPQGAQVFVNGVSVGITPLVLQDQTIGSRVVRVELAGHEKWSSSVRIVANQQATAVAQLRRAAVR
jgi:hypothetical protein